MILENAAHGQEKLIVDRTSVKEYYRIMIYFRSDLAGCHEDWSSLVEIVESVE